ncbi:hypothetical protein V6Z11_D07G142400 [Gossypium hirsutum]
MLYYHLMTRKVIVAQVRDAIFFGNFVYSCNLQYLGFIGPSFTWQRGNTYERLDRALANDTWISSFLHYLVFHLLRIKPDHMPILLKTNSDISAPKGRLFWFLAGWTKHANFPDLVRNKWSYSGTRKRQLIRLLANIQKAMNHLSSSWLVNLEMDVWDELENVLNHEKLL